MSNKKSKADKAFEIQDRINNLISRLDKLGFEFLYYNMRSSIRAKRDEL
jgi:hypothetical protein